MEPNSKQHKDILAVLDEVKIAIDWLYSDEGTDYFVDKDMVADHILTAVIVDILHIANKHNFDYRHIILFSVVRFALENSSTSKEFENLRDILEIAHRDNKR